MSVTAKVKVMSEPMHSVRHMVKEMVLDEIVDVPTLSTSHLQDDDPTQPILPENLQSSRSLLVKPCDDTGATAGATTAGATATTATTATTADTEKTPLLEADAAKTEVVMTADPAPGDNTPKQADGSQPAAPGISKRELLKSLCKSRSDATT